MVRLIPLLRPIGGLRLPALFEPGFERHRPREKESLITIAALLGKEVRLRLGLHALGDNAQIKGARDGDDRNNDRAVIRVYRRTLDELPVDLDLLQWQLLEVGQARVTSAEIIDREADPQFRQLGHARRYPLPIVDEQSLRDLEDQVRGTGAGDRERGAHAGNKIILVELQRADIDR